MHTCYSKKERFQQIEVFLQTHENATMTQIAKGIGMTRGGHVMKLLWEMQDDLIILGTPEHYRDKGIEGPGADGTSKGVRWLWSLARFDALPAATKPSNKKTKQKARV